jgi:hypothetical protein
VDPTYASLLAAEITPWSQRSILILISASDDHGRVIADELARHHAKIGRGIVSPDTLDHRPAVLYAHRAERTRRRLDY